jgi:predicted ATP-dependent serine protease
MEEVEPDLAVVDSVPVLGVTLDDLAKIHDGGRCSVVLITHLTKAGDPAGPSGLAHAVDIVARVESMEATTTKNRYAALAGCGVLP